MNVLTQVEVAQLVEASRGDMERALLICATETGARVGELSALEWGDIAWSQRSVALGKALGSAPSKSGKVRHVPLTATLVAALKRIRHQRGALVFCHEDGGPPTTHQLHQRLRAAAMRAGLGELRYSVLRYSHAHRTAGGDRGRDGDRHPSPGTGSHVATCKE